MPIAPLTEGGLSTVTNIWSTQVRATYIQNRMVHFSVNMGSTLLCTSLIHLELARRKEEDRQWHVSCILQLTCDFSPIGVVGDPAGRARKSHRGSRSCGTRTATLVSCEVGIRGIHGCSCCRCCCLCCCWLCRCLRLSSWHRCTSGDLLSLRSAWRRRPKYVPVSINSSFEQRKKLSIFLVLLRRGGSLLLAGMASGGPIVCHLPLLLLLSGSTGGPIAVLRHCRLCSLRAHGILQLSEVKWCQGPT
mmetsp:Transcript_44167/g.104549  ORF Transcript_44167/g.104549 Transcript_44167/m.104549 type:complete len:247 (+) Transcript_44167:117-857(+)